MLRRKDEFSSPAVVPSCVTDGGGGGGGDCEVAAAVLNWFADSRRRRQLA